MTVHWNSCRGFSVELRTASSADEQVGPGQAAGPTDKWLSAMSKVPPTRAAAVQRAKRLLADPDYPSPEVMRKVAELLVRHL